MSALDELTHAILHTLPGWRITAGPVGFGWAPERHYRAQLQHNAQRSNVIIRCCWTEEGYATELFMYRQLLPQLPIRTPELLGSFPLADGTQWMVLADLGTATVRGDIPAERTAFFAALGALHGTGLCFAQDTTLPLQVFSAHSEEYWEWESLLTQAIDHPPYGLNPRMLDLFQQTLPRLTQQPITVLHGDTDWSNAVLLEDGVGLIDWERACLGPAALDLGRLMSSEVTACELSAYHEAYCSTSSTETTFSEVAAWAQSGSIIDAFRWICYFIRRTEGGNPPDEEWQRKYYEPCIKRMVELSSKSS